MHFQLTGAKEKEGNSCNTSEKRMSIELTLTFWRLERAQNHTLMEFNKYTVCRTVMNIADIAP